jgi:hypothetical protein
MQETFMYILTFDSHDSIPASRLKVKAGVLNGISCIQGISPVEYEFQPFPCQP